MDYETQEKICEIIFYFIHAVPRLKYLYLRWCRLNSEDKYYLDREVLNSLPVVGKLLYSPLKKAFIRWDDLQDIEGAPGFQPGCHEYKCDAEIEKEITKVVNAFEVSLDNVYLKKDFATEEERIFTWTKVNTNKIKILTRNKLKRSKSLSDLNKNKSSSKRNAGTKSKMSKKSKSDLSIDL